LASPLSMLVAGPIANMIPLMMKSPARLAITPLAQSTSPDSTVEYSLSAITAGRSSPAGSMPTSQQRPRRRYPCRFRQTRSDGASYRFADRSLKNLKRISKESLKSELRRADKHLNAPSPGSRWGFLSPVWRATARVGLESRWG
jgi:hypothetical protein